MFLQFTGVGREQAERSSGNAAKQAVPMPELRRQGSLLPAYKKINSLLDRVSRRQRNVTQRREANND
jgi:hypothetical protein